MSADSAKNDRKKIALEQQTYDKLKTFSRFNGLKLRMVVDSMIDVVLQDDELNQRIVELTRQKETGDTQ